MNQFENSLAVAKQSWAVLRGNPSLAVFPVISAIGTVIVSVPFALPVFFAYAGQNKVPEAMGVLQFVLGFLAYAATYTVVIFFNAALVTCAYQELRGVPATPQDGIRNAVRHMPQIVGWALLAATVGQVIRSLQDKGGVVGAIVGGLAGFAWNLAVFFVVPIIVVEDLGPLEALRASADRLKRTWGEQLILNGGMGLVSFLVTVVPLAAAVALAVLAFSNNLVLLGVAILAGGLVYLLTAAAVLSCLTTIYQTALYVYSSSGTVPVGFSERSIAGAFVPKQRGMF